jgi:putative sigma-54 modulation protein
MQDAIHHVIEKAEKQARRARKKHMDKKRRAGNNHWPLEVLEATSVTPGTEPRVIKTTQLPIKPMTIDEAALELDRSKNEFFVFLDSTTERVSVIYRRQDKHYGLIAPEF